MKKFYRVSTNIDLPKDERSQAASLNAHVGVKFKSHREAVAALQALPESHLFRVYEVYEAMNPLD